MQPNESSAWLLEISGQIKGERNLKEMGNFFCCSWLLVTSKPRGLPLSSRFNKIVANFYVHNLENCILGCAHHFVAHIVTTSAYLNWE